MPASWPPGADRQRSPTRRRADAHVDALVIAVEIVLVVLARASFFDGLPECQLDGPRVKSRSDGRCRGAGLALDLGSVGLSAGDVLHPLLGHEEEFAFARSQRRELWRDLGAPADLCGPDCDRGSHVADQLVHRDDAVLDPFLRTVTVGIPKDRIVGSPARRLDQGARKNAAAELLGGDRLLTFGRGGDEMMSVASELFYRELSRVGLWLDTGEPAEAGIQQEQHLLGLAQRAVPRPHVAHRQHSRVQAF